MIEVISGNPESLVVVVAKGILTEGDYVNVLIPAIEVKLKTHERIRLLLQLDKGLSEFATEAMWDDVARLGFGRLKVFEAIAVVTDERWIADAVKLFHFSLGCPVKAFRKEKLLEAKDWAARNDSARRGEKFPHIAVGWFSETNTVTANSPILSIPSNKSLQPLK